MIVVDDAGDLGKGSKYFVLAGVTAYNDCRSLIREALNTAKVRKFHFVDDSDKVRRTFIGYISKMELKVTVYVLEKGGVKVKEEELLPILLRNVFPDKERVLEIFIDDFLNNEKLKRETERRLKEEVSRFFNIPCNVKLINEQCVQVADYFASIFWRHIERSDDTFYNEVKSKIKRVIYDIQ